MTPAELIETALREHLRIHPQERATAALKAGDPIPPSGGEAAYAAQIVLDTLAGAGMVVLPAQLLDDLTDADPCWFDFRGICRAHEFASLEPGERCPHAVAQEMLAALPERTDHADRD
ncbi:hypothetical protein ACQEUU_37210 [Nonomuraea sp. CA-218870]|uniref:hypothetical protein n=1 Tax=Nonomuraea sp. CA-218870 TaxID=3239998 RepID=UPI003D8EF922